MRFHSTVLITRQLGRLRDFYTETFRFHVVEDFGACVVLDCGISLWQPGVGHPVCAQDDTGATELKRAYGSELCFEADTGQEFEALAHSLQGSGLPLLHAMRTEPWGQRTLRLQDPDGNLIEWGESIPCFVCRLYEEEGDAAKVAALTGVAIERVRQLVASHRSGA